MRAPIVPILLALLATPALAQDREPVTRQNLVDLAYVLGEAHALRQVCQGPGDQFWRGRMIRLVETEQPDAAMERRLRENFNTGFATRQGQFPVCTPAARRAEAAAMAHGRALAGRLSRATRQARAAPDAGPPEFMADRPAPR
ncbi:MAG TPA: TIGR02301 family protein [Phenylobacterium sp.]|nr:TIGR02301 family protein [Phenylobacterium sp.]